MKFGSTRYALYGIALCVAVAGMAAPISAQEGDAPAATLSAAEITIDAGEQTTVDATYEFTVESAGSGENALSAISGTMWLFPDHAVGDVSATVNGEEVSPEVTRENRFMRVSVPVSDVSDGDTVSVDLSYTVADPTGQLKTPLWAPEFVTSGTDQAVSVTVSLPSDSQVHGAAFPRVDSVSGSTLSYELLHMPGFISVEYGSGAGSLLSLDVVTTLVGVGLILGFLGAWFLWRRRAVAEGGETSVV